jgi:DHA1 family multidrug resistance protein-like MFS transporter
MIGLGITLPILPLYAERLAMASGASRKAAAVQVGLLTGVYALMQFIFAPVWGHWSDRVGRKPVFLAGLAGFAASQVLFGVGASLWVFYFARILGGVLSSAAFPVISAYVADATTETERTRWMARQGASVSLGVVIGPAVGGLLAAKDLQIALGGGRWVLHAFSIPFFAAGLIGLLAVPVAIRWLPESHSPASLTTAKRSLVSGWRGLGAQLSPILLLGFSAQLGLAMFEATFALHAHQMLGYTPEKVGHVFVVCGLAMAVFQFAAVGHLTTHVAPARQIAVGFVLMGASLGGLLYVRSHSLVLLVVALLASGTSLITPNISALASIGRGANTGTSLGLKDAANSLGQAAGPIIGTLLFVWDMRAAYSLVGALLVAVGILAKARPKQSVRLAAS